MSSSAEHDSSKFTNRNGQGDYFVASSIRVYRSSNKREAKVRDQERERETVSVIERGEGPEGAIQQDVRVRPFGIVCTPELWENFHTWKYCARRESAHSILVYSAIL